MKGLIRQGEAVRAAVVTGVKEDNIYFLEMPFYETGTIKKSVINEKDIKIV
jgi:glucosamine-6-phosphate deaminase